MASVWGELKRRNVVKVAVAYAIVGWVLIEVSTTVLPVFEAPDWIAQVFTFFVILGFPLALILSWAYEITPEGIKLERDVAAGESITHVTGRKLDFAIIGALVLALGFVVYNYVLDGGEVVAGVLPNSVAVLLCANLSPDPDDAYIAASIHDEILNQLVKIRALNVIARTSVLQYADAPPPISQIAEELNVGAVMECTVRYAGDAILVTAQLIDPETNSHLWSDTYPGDLSDLSTVFAMQADIAKNIANAVGAELSLGEQERIEEIPTDSPEAYALYLQARSARDPSAAQRLLDQAIAFDRNFASAYAMKASLYSVSLISVFGAAAGEDRVELETLVRENAGKAIELDPGDGVAYLALAQVEQFHWRWAEAQKLFERAYQLRPNDVRILGSYAYFSMWAGEHQRSLSLAGRFLALEPNSAEAYARIGLAHQVAGDLDAAVASITRAVELNPAFGLTHLYLAQAEIARGNDAIGLQELRTTEQLIPTTNPSAGTLASLAYFYSQIDRNEDAERFVGRIEDMATSGIVVGAGTWALANLAVGKNDEALDWLSTVVEKVENNEPDPGYILLMLMKANLYFDPVLEEPRFRTLLDQIGAL